MRMGQWLRCSLEVRGCRGCVGIGYHRSERSCGIVFSLRPRVDGPRNEAGFLAFRRTSHDQLHPARWRHQRVALPEDTFVGRTALGHRYTVETDDAQGLQLVIEEE